MDDLASKIGVFFAKLGKSEKILAAAASAVIFIAIMDGLVLGPILSELKIMDKKITSKAEAIKRDKKITSFRDRIMDEYAKYSNYLDTGEFSQEEIIAALLKKIENLANQQTITVKNIQPGDVEEKPIFQVYKTSIECEGTLTDMLSFMHLLEQSDYLFEITRYSVGPKSKGADIVKCNMDIARTLIGAEKAKTGSKTPVSENVPELVPEPVQEPTP